MKGPARGQGRGREGASVSRRRVFGAIGAGALGVAAGAVGDRSISANASPSPALAVASTTLGTDVRLEGAGIDPTGRVPAAEAVQRLLDDCRDGDSVIVPSGAVLLLDRGLTVRKGVRFTGSGELRCSSSGSQGAPLITVLADDVWLDGLHLSGSDASNTAAVLVHSSRIRITSCLVERFRDGLLVSADGEFHDIVISNNLVLDIAGSGPGPTSASAEGESNGDGIVMWGAAATITGNRVTCADGADARIGIHVEALPDRARTPYAHANAMVTIAANVVTGPFRRGIVSEGVSHVSVTGNSIADATWWGMALIGTAHNCILANNTVQWTRTQADDAGASYSPHRSGIMLFCIQETMRNAIVSANCIEAVPGSSIENGVYLQADPGLTPPAASGLHVVDNVIEDRAGFMVSGIRLAAPTTRSHVSSNQVTGFLSAGIRMQGADAVDVSGNTTAGRGTVGSVGIQLEGLGSDARVVGNGVFDATTGISATARRSTTVINGNTVARATTGVDLASSGDAIVVSGNAFAGVQTAVVAQAGVVLSGNSPEQLNDTRTT